jgi:hypothetical protein
MERETVVVKNEVARTNRRSDASLLALARLHGLLLIVPLLLSCLALLRT